MDEQNSQEREERLRRRENLRDSVGLEKQLNDVRYDWQGGENSIEHVDQHVRFVYEVALQLARYDNSFTVLYEVALQLDKIIGLLFCMK